MSFPNLGPPCCMPRPKMMRTSWTLRGRLQYILAKGLFSYFIFEKKKKRNDKKKKEKKKRKKEKPKSDEYIVSPRLRQRVENF